MEKYMKYYENPNENDRDIKDENTADRKINPDESKKPLIKEKKLRNKIQCDFEKIRNIPHVEGNFSCCIYYKLESFNKVVKYQNKVLEVLNNILINNTVKEEKSFVYFKISDMKTNDMHISLSNNFLLKFHQIPSFVNNLKDRLKNNLIIEPFSLLLLKNIKYFANEYKTRFFLALDILNSSKMNNLQNIINEYLMEYNIYPFHKVWKYTLK